MGFSLSASMRSLLCFRHRALAPSFTTLPWRANTEAQPNEGKTMAGRGRGQRNVNASNVFSSSSKSSKSREELAQIVGSWKKNKPRQNRGQHASNQNQLDKPKISIFPCL